MYGSNTPEEVQIKGLCQLISEQLEDKVLRMLIFAAFIALILGIWKEGISTVVFYCVYFSIGLD